MEKYTVLAEATTNIGLAIFYSEVGAFLCAAIYGVAKLVL